MQNLKHHDILESDYIVCLNPTRNKPENKEGVHSKESEAKRGVGGAERQKEQPITTACGMLSEVCILKAWPLVFQARTLRR